MYFGGRDWDAVRVEQLTYFVGQYGAGHAFADWLRLPWNVYRESWRFGHIPDSYPPVLGLAAPLALRYASFKFQVSGFKLAVGNLKLERVERARAARWLLAITLALCLLWARGWQDLRFLLPAYPLLALLGAAGLYAVVGTRRAHIVELGLAALLAVTAAQHAWLAIDAAGVVAGREPAGDYLARKLPDFRAIEVLNRQVAPGRAALMLGDGQIWYCTVRCIPDPAHDNLLQWFVRPGSPEAARAALEREGVSHVLLSRRDFWYLQHQDPEHRLDRQLAEYYVFKAQYLDLVYEDALTEVYRGRW
jgi:hypothetical protein